MTEVTQWFESEYGSINCIDLREEKDENMIRVCGHMMEESFNKIMTMLTEAEIDIYQ